MPAITGSHCYFCSILEVYCYERHKMANKFFLGLVLSKQLPQNLKLRLAVFCWLQLHQSLPFYSMGCF